MTAVKGAILSLLLDAYQKRDRVGLIAFRGLDAALLLPPTNSVDQAHRLLHDLPAGGRTPLASGLALADRLLRQRQHAAADLTPLLVVLSDGRANVGLRGTPDAAFTDAYHAADSLAHRGIASLVIDCEDGRQRLALAPPLAAALKARCLRLDELASGALAQSVRTYLESHV